MGQSCRGKAMRSMWPHTQMHQRFIAPNTPSSNESAPTEPNVVANTDKQARSIQHHAPLRQPFNYYLRTTLAKK